MTEDKIQKAAEDKPKSPDEAEIRRQEQMASAIASWKHALHRAQFTRREPARSWKDYRSPSAALGRFFHVQTKSGKEIAVRRLAHGWTVLDEEITSETPSQVELRTELVREAIREALRRFDQVRTKLEEPNVTITENQATRQLFSEKFESLQNRITELESSLQRALADLAKSRELQDVARKLAEQIRLEGEQTTSKLQAQTRDLQAQIRDLQTYIQKFSPDKRYFKTALAFFGLFCFSEVIYALFRTEIIRPFWGTVGLIVTTCMLIVIYFGKRESDSEKPENQAK